MSVKAGTQLGSYEVVAQIGAGGMGEVYKANDPKLGRDVALKVLPDAFAHDPERLSRFQREAKMLASLNHPNIATIYGLEHSNGTHFLIMELVTGETLADRIKREGPVPLEEALKVAVQIAEALEAAHEKGIIHRDLKPANVKVTPEGKVKVLDFGLAKAFAGDVADSNPSQSPTLSAVATMQGVLLGTAAYMSPEQARGKAVDKRTDIWAFGCVLYELLTGKQAFQGEDITEILAAVVKTEPDWNCLPENTPPSMRMLLGRCLQKDKTLRLRDAGDARIEIHEALVAPAPSVPMARARSFAVGWTGAAILGLTAVVFLVIVGIAVWKLKPTPTSPPQPVTRTVINLPQGQQLAGLEIGPAVVLSPDGTRVAYVAHQSGTQQLYLHAMDSLEFKPVSGTEGAVTPFFSPDGQWLGFFSGGKLKKISVSGGAPITVSESLFSGGASWGGQGIIAFTKTAASVLQQVSNEGGTPKDLTRLGKGETSHRWPEFVADGKGLLFAAGPATNWVNSQIVVQSVATGEKRNLVQGGTDPHHELSGHLVYAQGGTLMAVPFDIRRLEVTGAAVPVVEGVLQYPVPGNAQYSISSGGPLIYVSGGVEPAQSRLVWVSRTGLEQPVAAPSH